MRRSAEARIHMDVKVTRQVRALSGDLLKPRYHVTCIITSEGPKTVMVRYACSDIALSRAMRFVVELVVGGGV